MQWQEAAGLQEALLITLILQATNTMSNNMREWLEAVRAPLIELIDGERGHEACALVVALPEGLKLIALRSVCRGSMAFAIPECEWARVQQWVASKGGRALCLVHSHPDIGASCVLGPSEVDRENMIATPGIPWAVVGRDGRPL